MLLCGSRGSQRVLASPDRARAEDRARRAAVAISKGGLTCTSVSARSWSSSWSCWSSTWFVTR